MSHDNKLENMLREPYSLSTRAPEWRKAFHLGTRLTFKKGTVICMGGEKSDLLYFIEKGEVRLMRTLADGREKIIFYLQAGALVGETPFFDKLPSLSSIVAGTNCVLYAFNRETVIKEYWDLTQRMRYASWTGGAWKPCPAPWTSEVFLFFRPKCSFRNSAHAAGLLPFAQEQRFLVTTHFHTRSYYGPSDDLPLWCHHLQP